MMYDPNVTTCIRIFRKLVIYEEKLKKAYIKYRDSNSGHVDNTSSKNTNSQFSIRLIAKLINRSKILNLNWNCID